MMVARLNAYSGLDLASPTLFLAADMLVLRSFDLLTLVEQEINTPHAGDSIHSDFGV
jgi:hypothetical protein